MHAEVVLMMDLVGVLMTSPFPAVRRLCETMMQTVFERTHMCDEEDEENKPGSGNHSTLFLARRYSNFFFTVVDFTEKMCGRKSALARLELGEINRLEFITAFRGEMAHMLRTLQLSRTEEMEQRMGVLYPQRVDALKKRYPLLADARVQAAIEQCMDVEAFLCTYEKVSPRRNVLNLLHYLRVKSKQEITLYAMGNTWESEGQYPQMVRAKELGTNSESDGMTSLGVDSCPVLYGGAFHSSFSLHGIFDSHVESYVHHKRKPYPDIFLDAVGEVMHRRMPSGETLRYGLKPFIFYFDDVASHCEVARQLPGNPFTEVYFVENGALDVYNDVVSALRVVAAKDAFWADVLAGVERDIAPLFRPPVDPQGRPVSWVTEEIHNHNNNLLFARPPANELYMAPNALQTTVCGPLSASEQNRLLLVCARQLPHLFPFILPPPPPPPSSSSASSTPAAGATATVGQNEQHQTIMRTTNHTHTMINENNNAKTDSPAACAERANAASPPPETSERDGFDETLDLVHQPSLATSAGPVVFEYMHKSGYFETHRMTLRTGSYVIRIEPAIPAPDGGVDIRREYETMRHIYACTSEVHVPPVLLFCPANHIFKRTFFIYRYRDGDAMMRIGQLIQPRVYRPFSHARTQTSVRLVPKLFYREAIRALVALQRVPLTPAMRAEVEQRRRNRPRVHPLLHDIQTWFARYRALTATTCTTNNTNTTTTTDTSSSDIAEGAGGRLRCAIIDTLMEQLTSCFDDTLLSQCMIPTPNRLVIVHGNYRLKSFTYSHRSLEGRAKYPPTIVSTGRFGFTRVGDPLVDVAGLSLFTLLPAPSGIYGTGKKIQDMFPTSFDILEMYCSMRGYLLHLDRARRENIFSVYLAALCLQKAIAAVAEVSHALRTQADCAAPAAGGSLPDGESTSRPSRAHFRRAHDAEQTWMRASSSGGATRVRGVGDAEDVAQGVNRVMARVKDLAQRGVELLMRRSDAKM